MNLEQYGIEMWPASKVQAFRKALLDWYDESKRDLPWRHSRNPYHIWVSEIMCQQTRVDTVIPYYRRFLEKFPTIDLLAVAPEEELLKVWEGLGYYSRVRNMQIAAKQIMTEFAGEFPKTLEGISSLKGIGPYTAGAIASIAFNLPEPAVDGNLMRVLSRLFEVDLDIGNPSNRKVFQMIAEILIDPERPGDFNQALMDLGADIEAPVNPRPEESPVKEFSAAYLHGTMDKYPIKIPKKKPKVMQWQAFVIQNENGEYLLEKNVQADLLNGFWHFPLIQNFEYQQEQLDLFDQVAESSEAYIPNHGVPMEIQFQSIYQMPINLEQSIPGEVKHVFSHQKWYIQLKRYTTTTISLIQLANNRQLCWVAPEEFSTLPFSKVQTKMWEHVRLYNAKKQ